MDLGATLCTRSKPQCAACPFVVGCVAHAEQRVAELPASKPRKAIPMKSTTMLLLLAGNEILLEKRPPTGIWGGLWSLPEIDPEADVIAIVSQRFALHAAEPGLPLQSLTHAFSHFRLNILPLPVHVQKPMAAEQPGRLWLEVEDALGAALPAPVRRILEDFVLKKPLNFVGK
jgi:A/G-specific adenine glycosylase